jgi:hypothetical protein
LQKKLERKDLEPERDRDRKRGRGKERRGREGKYPRRKSRFFAAGECVNLYLELRNSPG